MQFLAYVIVVLVSFSTILLELHWLTAPTKQPQPVAQASVAPSRAKIDGPNVELSPVYPKPDAPRSVGSVTGSPPAAAEENTQAAAAAPPAPVQTPAPVESTATVKAEIKAEPKTETKHGANVDPAQVPASPQTATVATKFETKSETSGAATPADSGVTFKSTVTQSPPVPDKTGNAAPAAQAAVAKNSCDVQGCARAYSSFSEADCTYQPFQGPRQLCVKPPAQAQQRSAAVAREPNAEGERKQAKDAELQRAVQFLRGRRAADEADYNEPMDDRGRDVVVRRPGWRW